ncbi:MAG: VWA domain-containing protein [Sedimentisphaerales bacterium]|nr:VWA domain-containing protein [Sedimentisphaerales bacterium]
MQLHSPWALLLLWLVPALVLLRRRRRFTAGVRFSDVRRFGDCPVSIRQRLQGLPFWFRLFCLVLLIVALARPRKGTAIESLSTEGVAMEIVVDRSSSMSEKMLFDRQELNRLEVVKKVAEEFIAGNSKDLKGRPGDLIGLISFARYADTLCPLVHSHEVLLDFLRDTHIVQLRSEDGTAIGNAIQLAAARLKKAEQQIQENNARLMRSSNEEASETPDFTIRSKIIILLTDGRDTIEESKPLEAAALARDWGIKIYPIGIGSEIQPRGFLDLRGQTGPDDRLLTTIAQMTGGFYGRATDTETLREIYRRIDALEKTEVKSVQYVDFAEQFSPWALGGLLLLLLEMILSCTVFRKIP